MLITAVIDAIENRDVAIADVPGAFLTADLDEEVIMLLDGELAELMEAVSPSTYREYVTVGRKGKKMLYVSLNKALYGLLRSALLFYRKLKKELIDYGLHITPYDPCVANMHVGGKTLTVTWHVDDLKISHEDPAEVTKFLDYLEKIYGPMTVNRGRKHTYLGMDLDYETKGVVKVSMKSYIQETLDEFPEVITETRTTPSADHLFKVNKNGIKLTEERAILFHRYVAKLLFISKRARPDIQHVIPFLSTPVRFPDEDDWKKLLRLLMYLKGTIELELTLGGDNLSVVKWWVDASYACHNDMKGHTGATMSFGRGAVTSASKKAKDQYNEHHGKRTGRGARHVTTNDVDPVFFRESGL